MRRKIVAANWKMHKTYDEAKSDFMHINSYVRTHHPECKVVICPTAIYLSSLESMFNDSQVKICSQDVSSEEQGAYTGEVSAAQLKSIGVVYSLVGHSERRKYHEDNNKTVAQKVKLLFKEGLRPIVCVGESLEQRKNETHFNLVKEQVLSAIEGLTEDQIKQIIFAYEPIWAIGTGETASPNQAQEMHAYIRTVLAEQHHADIANQIRIIYGGSVKVGNARDLFDQPDVDGGLVGGASLNPDDFIAIINACG